jgi:hypothetical protein
MLAAGERHENPLVLGEARALRKAALVMGRRAHSRVLGLAAIAFVTGCFDMGGGGGSCASSPNGLAGKGTFEYACKGSADPACEGGDLFGEARMPASVARGSTFGLTLVGGSPDAVEAVSPRAVSGSRGTFTARRAGHVGFVASEDGEAIDAVRLLVVEPERLAIGPIPGTPDLAPRLDLALSTLYAPTAHLRAVAMSGGAMLGGTMKVSWTIDDPEVASLSVGADYSCTVTGMSPGSTTLHATSDAFVADMVVSVSGTRPPDPFDAGGDTGTDAEPDAADAGADQ